MIRWSPVAAVIAFAGAAAAQPGLLATAQAFKLLSEGAFSTPDPALEAQAARASAMVTGMRPTLPPGAARDAQAELQALEAARRAHDRAGVALASADVYRILVSLSDQASKVPPEVRLLDYARLRYNADLRARPPRWDDARDAVAFALGRWTAIAPRVTDGSLRLKVDDALNRLNIAAGDRDPGRADRASNDLLDLIQQLDAVFVAL
jgi:hypothetical protein